MERNFSKLSGLGHTTVGLLAALLGFPDKTAVELFELTSDYFRYDNVNPSQILTSLKRARERGYVKVKGRGIANDPHKYYLTDYGMEVATLVVKQANHRTVTMKTLAGCNNTNKTPDDVEMQDNVVPLRKGSG